MIRPVRDEDALDLIELIASVFGEYRGCVTDVDGEMPELRGMATYIDQVGGEYWVAERDGRIVGMGGYGKSGEGVELKKLYVHRRERGTGLGARIVDLIEAAAKERRAPFIELWSDTRFTTAHAFYEKRGYVRGPDTRELHDLSKTVEYYFRKTLPP
jgi:putative acetyltransferase